MKLFDMYMHTNKTYYIVPQQELNLIGVACFNLSLKTFKLPRNISKSSLPSPSDLASFLT